MEQHSKNGLAVAEFLESHPMVRRVLYPGLSSHPQHALAKRQCSGFSGVVSFYINGGAKAANTFVKHLKYFQYAVSFGSVESLVEIPIKMSHASAPKDHMDALGIDESLLRLSVGIENVDDLIADLNNALSKAHQV